MRPGGSRKKTGAEFFRFWVAELHADADEMTTKVPYLTEQQIERDALGLLEAYFHELDQPIRIPIPAEDVLQDYLGLSVLGDAYEYLIGKFADVTRRNKAGEFYTPRSVVRMMVEILDPKEGESIYDPACGTGGMLLGAIEHVARNGGDPRTFFGKIYGQHLALRATAHRRGYPTATRGGRVVQDRTRRGPSGRGPPTHRADRGWLVGLKSGDAAPFGVFLLPGRRCSQPGFFHCKLFKSPTMRLSDSRYDSFHSAV
jgi:hypothetical protein